LFNAAATSSILMQSSAHSLTPAAILWSLSFSSSISFSIYSFHEPLIFFSSTITLPETPFSQFDPIISCLSFTICFAVRKISFWWLRSFKLLANSFCFFPFAKEITLFTFCLLFLYSHHASVDFSFFSDFYTFLLFPYCFSNFLIPPPRFLLTEWAFWQSTCV